MEEKLRVCFSSLSFQYLPQSHSGCSAMNLPVLLLLPPSSIRCRSRYPSVALSAYWAAGEITPRTPPNACVLLTNLSVWALHCPCTSYWTAPVTGSEKQEHPVPSQLTQQSYFTSSGVPFSLLFPQFVHVWIQWDLTWFSSIYAIKCTGLWWLINEFYS